MQLAPNFDVILVLLIELVRLGVSLIAALRAAAQPQFSQSNLPTSLFKTYKILTYNT